MEQILINGMKALKGENPFFEEITCFGLEVGKMVKSIGKLFGRSNTGGNMMDEFIRPVKYVGIYTDTDNGRYMAFKLNKEDVSGWNLFNQITNAYLLYSIDDEMLFRPDFNLNKCWTLYPVFN